MVCWAVGKVKLKIKAWRQTEETKPLVLLKRGSRKTKLCNDRHLTTQRTSEETDQSQVCILILESWPVWTMLPLKHKNQKPTKKKKRKKGVNYAERQEPGFNYCRRALNKIWESWIQQTLSFSGTLIRTTGMGLFNQNKENTNPRNHIKYISELFNLCR